MKAEDYPFVKELIIDRNSYVLKGNTPKGILSLFSLSAIVGLLKSDREAVRSTKLHISTSDILD
jgi:hypothetical protein